MRAKGIKTRLRINWLSGRRLVAVITCLLALGQQTFTREIALQKAYIICIQDDSRGHTLYMNSLNGDYLFMVCRKHRTRRLLVGRGNIFKKGNVMALTDHARNHQLMVVINLADNTGNGKVTFFDDHKKYSVNDSNTLDSSCACPQ